MWRNVLTLLLIFSLALNLAFAGVWVYHRAYVQPRLMERLPPPSELPAMPWAEQALELRDPQRSRVRTEYAEFRKKMWEIRTRAEQNRVVLLDLLAAPKPDRKAIQECLSRIAADNQKLQELVVEHLLALKGMISPQQVQRLMNTLRSRSAPQGGMPLHRPLPRPGQRPGPPPPSPEARGGPFRFPPARAGRDSSEPLVQEE